MHIVFCRYLCSYWMLLHIWAKHAVIMALPLIIHTTYADEVWFKFSWHFIFLSLNRFRVCSALAASIVFPPWLDANGRCSQVAYPWRDRLKVVVLLPFGWILNEISYRLWLDWTFLVVVGIGQSLNVICWYDLWSSSTWSETCVYLHQASWVMHSVLRCATSGFWRQARRCTGRTIKAWDVI